jgi:hypothetical protein
MRARELSMDTAADIDSLLWHFGHQLPDDRQDEFHRAAESALAHLACLGPGAVHRVVAGLFSNYFIPIPDELSRKNGARKHRRSSKLVNAAPLA